MARERFQQRHGGESEPEQTYQEEPHDGGGDDGLRAQASAWAEIARRARESCDDAEQELTRRQNSSGE